MAMDTPSFLQSFQSSVLRKHEQHHRTSACYPDQLILDIPYYVYRKLLTDGKIDKADLLAEFNNVSGAILSLVRKSLGPSGCIKLIINPAGNVIITKKGKNIVVESDLQHPLAKIFEGLVKALNSMCMDGTKTSTIIACSLIKQAVNLIESVGLNPSEIISGYRLAAEKCFEMLEYLSRRTSPKISREDLLNVAITELANGGYYIYKRNIRGIAEYIVEIVKEFYEIEREPQLDLNERLQIVKTRGAGELIFLNGVAIDERPDLVNSPRIVKNAKILVLKQGMKLDLKKHSFLTPKNSLVTTNLSFLREYNEWKKEFLKEIYDKIIGSGINVVICEGDIDRDLETMLVKKGIYVLKKLKEKDVNKISLATGAKPTNVRDITSDSLGYAECVRLAKIGDKNLTIIEGCRGVKSLVVVASSNWSADLIQEVINGAINAVTFALVYEKVVPGGGATEMELAVMLREFSKAINDKRSLVVESASIALEEIPRILIENSGGDPLGILPRMREHHYMGHIYAHIDASGKLCNERHVLDPFYTKASAIVSAFETACMMLRIDAILRKR